MTRPRNVSRRAFLAASAALIPASALGLNGRTGPAGRVNMGAIGNGPQGMGVLRGFMNQPDVQVVAVCDVKTSVREAAQQAVNAHYSGAVCEAYHCFEDLLARDDIDAVLVATPDHWHVLAALAAVRAGKDVYVEKPLGLSLGEDQALRAAVHRHGAVFQFGTQQRSGAQFRLACELVRNGRIGELKTINVWSPPSNSGGPTTPVPIPEGLDYDRWLGPAPYAPYTQDRCSNQWWWFNSDYALGFIAGWGVHPLDIALWGAGDLLRRPVTVRGAGDFPTEGFCDTATQWRVEMDFDGGLRLNYTGWPAPEEWMARYPGASSHGTAFEGTEGWIHVHRSLINASRDSILRSPIGPNDLHLHKSIDHAADLVRAVKDRGPTACPVDEAVEADILCHLSDIATRLPRPLRWDWQAERFVDDPEANRMLTRSMRSPWRL